MNITKLQRELMKHTISGPDRNWFATDEGYKDADAFDELVGMGLATKEKAPEWCGDDVIYRLTKEGKAVL